MNGDDFINYAFAFLLAVVGLALLVFVVVSVKCQLYGGCYYPQATIELKGGDNAGSSGNN